MRPARNSVEPITKNTGSPPQTRDRTSSGTLTKVLSRNIDQVVLGDLCFQTWYHSPYPDTVVYGEHYHTPRPALHEDHTRNGHAEIVAAPVIDRLYVCAYCFRYTRHTADYVGHLSCCLGCADEDGEWKPVPDSAEKVYEWDGYTIWDVDGEREKLYCQNLSLFAKLFLEQKSVFFDTSGFHYFVLTRHAQGNAAQVSDDHEKRRKKTSAAGGLVVRDQVLGFFSKENLSWDANNLACILVFPPYQHRNLGQLLMAASYKLSGWEWEGGVIGGPEKPLSAMGLRSYLRFWSERIARFFMGQSRDAEGRTLFETEHAKKKSSYAKEEMSVQDIGNRTGMLPEDVIAALQAMGICQVTPQKRRKKSDEMQNLTRSEEPAVAARIVKRSEVLAWAQKNNATLVNPVAEEGFLGEWALSNSDRRDDSSEGAISATS